MQIEIAEKPMTFLPMYGQIPISFEVRHVLECSTPRGGLGGVALVERAVAAPYVKDYDRIEGNAPRHWTTRFDTSRWGLLVATLDGTPVGGATLAFDTPHLDMLEGRRDLAVLWDLRVAPEFRGRGVGAALFDAGVAWAKRRDCRRLKVETQNVNLPACRFYVRRGCELGAVHRFAYGASIDEVQLLWYRALA